MGYGIILVICAAALILQAVAWRRAADRRAALAFDEGHDHGVAWRNDRIEARMRNGWRLELGADLRPRWADMAGLGLDDLPAASYGVRSPAAGPDAAAWAASMASQAAAARAALGPAVTIQHDADALQAMADEAALAAALEGDDELARVLSELPPIGRHVAVVPALEPPPHPMPAFLPGLLAPVPLPAPGEPDNEGDVAFADPPPVLEVPLAVIRDQARRLAGLDYDTGQFRARMDAERVAWCRSVGID